MPIPSLSTGSPFRLGSFFVFASADAFQENHYAWLRHIPGLKLPRTGSVLPLFGSTPLQLPGATFEARLAALSLGTVTPDRDLYRQGHDAIRLLVVDPMSPGARITVELLLHGTVSQACPVQLDGNGAGLLELHDLTAGDYQARIQGQERLSSFTVAEYRLVPLVGMLIDHRRSGHELSVVVRLETFGHPVEGPVRVDLMEGGRCQDSQELTCAEGLLRGMFTLTGPGAHSLRIQRQELTATVTLPGTRKEERELTLFSTLGNEVQGSLLPEPGSTEVRGLHLSEGATRNAPLKLEHLATGRARLTASTRCESVRAMVLDPGKRPMEAPPTPPTPDVAPAYWLGLMHYQNGEYELAAELFARGFEESPDAWIAHYRSRALAGAGEVSEAKLWLRKARDLGWGLSQEEQAQLGLENRDLHREVMEAGETLELEVPAPLGVLAVGCYVEGRPWEGWAAVIVPVSLEAALEMPGICEPGEEIELCVQAPEEASVFLLVRDSRLSRQDSPETALAARLKSYVAGLPPSVTQVEPRTVSARTRSGLVAREEFRGFAARPSLGGQPAARRGMMRPAGFSVPTVLGGSSALPPAAEAASFAGQMDSSVFSPSAEPMDFGASDDLFGASSFGAPADGDRLDFLGRGAMPSFSEGVADFRIKPAPRTTSTHEAEVLLAEFARGPQKRSLRVPKALGDFQVELFVLHGRHWRTFRQRLRVVSDLHVELDVPPVVFPGDEVTGRVLLVGEAEVRLWRDGQSVELGPDLTFPAPPGHYRVEAGDRAAETVVSAPGKLRRRVRGVRLLRAGESIALGGDVAGFHVLPNLDLPLETLAEATTDYAYCCCEQTSTRLVAAATMLALARGSDRKRKAEAALRAGLQRLESMWIDGRGFRIYPGDDQVVDSWSRLAAVNLRALRKLTDDPRAVALDDRARRLYPDLDRQGLAGLYWHLPANQDQAVREARLFLTQEKGRDRVAWRHQAAFAVAILVKSGDLESCLATANAITADLNEQGMLYSTHDSVAALAMFRELAASGLLNGEARVQADERSLQVLEGLATVQVDRVIEEDWSQFSCAVGLRVWWEPRSLKVGEAVDLHIQLEDGYQMGDLVFVNLPACLTRVTGGGQVKQFAVDFEGKSELKIPLVATGTGSQHFTLCVRNMFDEERAGSPGMLRVDVSP